MRIKTLIILISLSFILSNLQLFLPLLTSKTNVFALLVINVILLLFINIIQERPAIDEITDNDAFLSHFHVQAYLLTAGICCLVQFVFVIGYFSFGWERKHIYDVILLLIATFLFLLGGKDTIRKMINS